MSLPSHILVGIDGSAQSLAAWHDAVALARCCRSALTALHVAVPNWSAGSFERDAWRAIRSEEAARVRGHQILEAARLAAADLDRVTYTFVFGDAAESISQQAREIGADLIVLGGRGKGSLARFLPGSVSSAVIGHAPCSILIVHES